MGQHDAGVGIPLQHVASHGSNTVVGGRTGSSTTARDDYADQTPIVEKDSKQGGLFHRHTRGRRRMKKVSSKPQGAGVKGYDGEEDKVTVMGRFYDKFTNFSIITRYSVYVVPVGAAIAVPIVIGATVAPRARLGGVRIVWFFMWIEIVWLSLWIAKIFAHFLPSIFQFFAGVVSSGTRKYALVLRALVMPISFALWALCSLTTFVPIMTGNPDQPNNDLQHWESIVQSILAACLVASLVFLAEKLLVQLISISYHRTQFNAKIIDSKHNVYLLCQLFEASRALFPLYCHEFEEEDYLITDSMDLAIGTPGRRSGSATPIRVLQKVGRYGDKVAGVVGNVAHEITGKEILNPEAAHSIVTEALERNRSAEALAKRLWMSFVVEGRESLYPEDIHEVLGPSKKDEADECFTSLDRDGNGDISLDEMILTVTEIGRERKSVASSMHDVDQAIKVLDGLLVTVVFIICIFILVAFVNRSFVTTLATAGTALLSLSFVFAGTCQEVLGSCIFIFVKHPFDIGDRVDVSDVRLTVEHISLLFTVFKEVSTGRMVQIPNIVLNGLWINNVSRSKAMREQLSIPVHFDTSFEDVKALRREMQNFVLDKDNSRDFQPEIEVEVLEVNAMDKLTLRIEIRHKSNWANETVRAARRSKFMCALVLALRKVPIYAPGGGDAALGSMSSPSYSVAISESTAQAEKDKFAAKKEAKRLNPSKPAEPATSGDEQFPSEESQAIDAINSRAPNADFARDAAFKSRELHAYDSNATLSEQRPSTDQQTAELEEMRGMLRRNSTRGKRSAGATLSPTPSPSRPQQYQQQHYQQQYQASGGRMTSIDEARPGYTSPLGSNPPGTGPSLYPSPYAQQPQQQQPVGPPPMQRLPPPAAAGPYQQIPAPRSSPLKGPVYKPSGAPPGDRGPSSGGVHPYGGT